jgi:hypothetical protein
MRRLAIITALVASGLLGFATPALADPGWGSTDCSQVPNPACDIGAGKGGTPPTGPGGGTGTSVNGGGDGSDPYAHCRYVEVDYQDPGGQPTESGAWYMVVCSPDGKDPLTHGPVFVPDANGQPALSPEQVAQMARNRLSLPAPRIAANPVGDQLVNLPTWLWLSSWEPVSATASVPGVSVTAVATPTSVSWSMGDGSVVTCAGPGTPFRPGGDPRAPSPDCGHTYRSSSANQPGQAFPVTATVHWTVTWSGAGQSGTFPDLTTTGNAAFRVAESQALNNGS